MASALDNFLDQLAAVEAAVIPTDGITPIGSGNTYAHEPKPNASTPLTLPCVINVVEAWDDENEREYSGRLAPTYLIGVYLLGYPNDEQDAWLDVQPYITPMKKAFANNITFNDTCAFSESAGGKAGYFRYRDRLYYGLSFKLLADIHEML